MLLRQTAAGVFRPRSSTAVLPAWQRCALPTGAFAAPKAPIGLRLVSGLTAPISESVANAQAAFPDGSLSQQLLDKCLEAAISRGVDLSTQYEPWIPVDMMQTLMVDVHNATGCSWFAAIILACISIRVVTLPIAIAAIRGQREKAVLQPRFSELQARQQEATKSADQSLIAESNKQIQDFTTQHGKFFMLKGSWNLVCFQMPLYVTAFAAMRGIASHPDIFPGFAMESPLWLDSLALADPYALLPCMSAAIMLTNIEIYGSVDNEVLVAPTSGQSEGGAGQNPFAKYQKWMMRGTTMLFLPMTWNFPAGVFVFMSTNMVATVLQNRLVRLPAVERILELPPTPEKAAATAELLRSSGPPALIRLGYSLVQDNRARKISNARGTGLLGMALTLGGSAPKVVEQPDTERRRKDVLEFLQTPTTSTSRPGSFADLQASPRFAVKRASSARQPSRM